MVGVEVADFALDAGFFANEFFTFLGIFFAGFSEGRVAGFEVVGLEFEGVGFSEVIEELGRFGDFSKEGGLVAGVLGFVEIGEDAVERVVIFGGNGVEFVVVATRAGDGEAEEGFAGDVDAVVDDVVGDSVEFVTKGKETEGGEGALVERGLGVGVFSFGFLDGRGEEAIGGELFNDELVVGKIAVEGVDDVVPIGPGVGVTEVLAALGVAFGVGVAGDIEPVAAPTFAVGRGGEEAIDELGVSVRRGVGYKGVDLRGGGRESGEIEAEAADKGAPIGGGVGGEAVILQGRENERVDWVLDPGGVGRGGRSRERGFLDGLECPMVFADAAVGG